MIFNNIEIDVCPLVFRSLIFHFSLLLLFFFRCIFRDLRLINDIVGSDTSMLSKWKLYWIMFHLIKDESIDTFLVLYKFVHWPKRINASRETIEQFVHLVWSCKCVIFRCWAMPSNANVQVVPSLRSKECLFWLTSLNFSHFISFHFIAKRIMWNR